MLLQQCSRIIPETTFERKNSVFPGPPEDQNPGTRAPPLSQSRSLEAKCDICFASEIVRLLGGTQRNLSFWADGKGPGHEDPGDATAYF